MMIYYQEEFDRSEKLDQEVALKTPFDWGHSSSDHPSGFLVDFVASLSFSFNRGSKAGLCFQLYLVRIRSHASAFYQPYFHDLGQLDR